MANKNADLGAVRLKVARAKSRLDDLRADVDTYLSADPCRIENHVEGTTYSLRSFIDAAPDQEWAVDVSEIANHGRSALDQLVWQLVIANGNDPRQAHTQFPIEVDSVAYFKGKTPKRERLLKGVASKHRRIIDNYQPFHAGRSVRRQPLFILNRIAKSEKHRAGHVVLGTASACRAKVTSPNGEEMTVSFKRAMPLTHDSDFLALENTPDPNYPAALTTMELVDFQIDVGFRDDEDDIVLLADIERGILDVSRIVERCAAKL